MDSYFREQWPIWEKKVQSHIWRRILQISTLVGALLTLPVWYKLTDPGTDGCEVRWVKTPYSEVIDDFLSVNPGWSMPKNAHYSTSHIGKDGNFPYASLPLIYISTDGNILDLAWPQSSELSDRISIVEFLEKNHLSHSLIPQINDVLIAEDLLVSPSISLVRRLTPDTILSSWSDRSHSAMKVKPRFFKDFSPEDQRNIVERAMNYQMKSASRDRALTFGRETLHTEGSYKPLYQILGYPDVSSAIQAFLKWEVDTKMESGFALGVSILQYIQSTIDTANQKIWLTKDSSGNVTADFPGVLYTQNIYRIIQDRAWYKDIVRPLITPQERIISQEIDQIQWQIGSLWKTLIDNQKKWKLTARLRQLEAMRAPLITQRTGELTEKIDQIARSHMTITRSDLNTASLLISELDRAAAFYPTNIDRALGKRGLGTHDQYMLSLHDWNQSFQSWIKPDPLGVDGDPGKKTQDRMSRFGYSDAASFRATYQKTQDAFVGNMSAWQPMIEASIRGEENSFPNLFSWLVRQSLEHRYTFVRILYSYLSDREKASGWDSEPIKKFRSDLSIAWEKYIQDTDEKSLNALIETVSNPRSFHQAIGNLWNISEFYRRWMIPRLWATTYILSSTGIVTPMIQHLPSRVFGFATENEQNTLRRAHLNPSSTWFLAPSGVQDFRRGPLIRSPRMPATTALYVHGPQSPS